MSSQSLPLPQHVYWVVLAGGGGTRLWPLSRAEKPKQFLELTDTSLIEQSLERLRIYPDFKDTNVYVSTAHDQAHHIYKMMDTGLEIKGTIEEPGRRDTGPAILLAVLTILQKDPQAHIMFLPSDPFIPSKDYQNFSNSIQKVMAATEKEEKIVLLGRKPDYPATGFGYIEYKEDSLGEGPKNILRFHEKPKLPVAEQYLKRDNMLWNMGMFAGRAEVFAKLFRKYAPSMYDSVKGYIEGSCDYMSAEKKSVDFAIMEPASLDSRLMVVPCDSFSWQDVGNIDTFLTIKNQFIADSGQESNPIIEAASHANKAISKRADKLIAFVGVEGLCVVDTENTLLISKCSEAENVKHVVNKLNTQPDKYAPYL